MAKDFKLKYGKERDSQVLDQAADVLRPYLQRLLVGDTSFTIAYEKTDSGDSKMVIVAGPALDVEQAAPAGTGVVQSNPVKETVIEPSPDQDKSKKKSTT